MVSNLTNIKKDHWKPARWNDILHTFRPVDFKSSHMLKNWQCSLTKRMGHVSRFLPRCYCMFTQVMTDGWNSILGDASTMWGSNYHHRVNASFHLVMNIDINHLDLS